MYHREDRKKEKTGIKAKEVRPELKISPLAFISAQGLGGVTPWRNFQFSTQAIDLIVLITTWLQCPEIWGLMVSISASSKTEDSAVSYKVSLLLISSLALGRSDSASQMRHDPGVENINMEFGGIGVKGQFPGEPQPPHLHLAHSHPQRRSRPALGGQLEIVPAGLVRRAKPVSLRFLNGVLNLHAPALPSWKRLISPSSSQPPSGSGPQL